MKKASYNWFQGTIIGLILICGSSLQAQNSNRSVPSAFKPVLSTSAPTPFLSIDSSNDPDGDLTSYPQIVSLNSSEKETAITQILHQGRQLITEKNWSEARSLFEKSSKKYPQNRELKAYLLESRFHMEISARYHDQTYCSLLAQSSISEILALYDEILNNIQTYHVDMPGWDRLFVNGLNCFAAALTEDSFWEKNRIPVENQGQIVSYFEKLRSYCERWEIRTKDDLRNAILKVAEQMYQNAKLSASATIMEFVCGMTSSLDTYSSYLTLSQINDLYSIIDGQFVGLGVEIQLNSNPLLIERVISGSPAQAAGLQNGDRIINIDGVDITKLQNSDYAGNLLSGKEGSTVSLTLLSPEQKKRQVSIVRRRFDVPSIENIRLLKTEKSQKIGYLKITCFQKTTASELSEALMKLSQQGMQCLIIDLRKNPGGLLQEAIDVANLFVDKGLIVKTRGRFSEKPYYAQSKGTWNVPLVLLIDEQSASAAEIFAGAIHDNHRGRLVGTRSFGKGTVQAIIQLTGKQKNQPIAGLRLTTEKFYAPSGYAYSGVGVEPDVVISEDDPLDYVVAHPIISQNNETNSINSVSVSAPRSDQDKCLIQALKEAQSLISSRY